MDIKNDLHLNIPTGYRLYAILSAILLIDANFYLKTSFTFRIYIPFFLMAVLFLSHGFFHQKIDTFIIIFYLLQAIQLYFTYDEKHIDGGFVCFIGAEIAIITYMNYCRKRGRLQECVQLFGAALKVLYFVDVLSVLFSFVTNNYTNASFGLAGHKNYHSFLFIATIGFVCLNRRYKRDARIIGYGVISLICEVLMRSSSGVVAITFFLAICLVGKDWKNKILNLKWITVILVIINLLILGGFQSGLLDRLLELIGRDSSFTGRTLIWDKAFRIVAENPWIGHGYVCQVEYYNQGVRLNHCHNFFLNLLLTGGIVYLALIILLLWIVGKKLSDNTSVYSNYILYMIATYLLLGVSEIVVNANSFFYPLLFWGWCINEIDCGEFIE